MSESAVNIVGLSVAALIVVSAVGLRKRRREASALASSGASGMAEELARALHASPSAEIVWNELPEEVRQGLAEFVRVGFTARTRQRRSAVVAGRCSEGAVAVRDWMLSNSAVQGSGPAMPFG